MEQKKIEVNKKDIDFIIKNLLLEDNEAKQLLFDSEGDLELALKKYIN